MDSRTEELSFPRRKSRKRIRESKKRKHRRKIRGLIIKSIFSFILLCFVLLGLVRMGIFPGLQEYVAKIK